VAVYGNETKIDPTFGSAHGIDISTDPASSRWDSSLLQTDDSASPRIADASCATASLCVAVDDGGNAIAATPRPPGLTPAEIGPGVKRSLLPHGRAARVSALLRRRRYTSSFSAPAAGDFSVVWRARSVRGALVPIALGGVHFDGPGTAKVTIRISDFGRRLLRRNARTRISAQGVFRLWGREPIEATRTFTVHR
jgi:hypothetical protein